MIACLLPLLLILLLQFGWHQHYFHHLLLLQQNPESFILLHLSVPVILESWPINELLLSLLFVVCLAVNAE